MSVPNPASSASAVLEGEIKALLIKTLELEDIPIDDIVSDEPLFEDGLGLDSIDALEIGLMLQEEYGVVIDAEDEATKEHFASVTNLAQFVQRNRATT